MPSQALDEPPYGRSYPGNPAKAEHFSEFHEAKVITSFHSLTVVACSAALVRHAHSDTQIDVGHQELPPNRAGQLV